MTITEMISAEELRAWNARSNWHGLRLIVLNWLMIAAIFAVVATWTNALTILIGLFLLGGRQLGLGVLMHECGHRSLFASRKANDMVGQWLCAWPLMTDMYRYAKGHARHHRYAGTDKDPDLGNYQSYPIARDSFRRKVIRDLSGQTGWKLLSGRFGNDDPIFGASVRERGFAGFVLTLLVIFAVLSVFGHGWLVLMWPAAFLTTYLLFARIRQIAEHAAVPDLFDLDPRKNTRTTLARWWERMVFAPNHVNFHLEHHLAAGVPCYRLPAFHRFLAGRGVYADTVFPVGYAAVLSNALTD